MSARTKQLERSRRFRRLHGEKKAVSPVVATLILILIAVAAAAALYLWLVAWQGGVTKGIGSPGAQYTVTIGGSTSVYPFASQAASWFEQNNSDVVISVNQGGSGAGAAAVCGGQVDIGEMSAFYSASQLETSYGCPSTLNEQIIAYDGVDVITQSANPHGLQSMNWETLQSVIAQASTTAPSSGFIYGLGETNGATFNGVAVPSAVPAQGTEFAWDQLPACAQAQALCASTPILSGVSVAASNAPLMPNAPAAADTETGISTITNAPSCTAVSGTFTVTGTSVFGVVGYNTSATETGPTLTVSGCTGGTDPTLTAPVAAKVTSATENAGNTAVTTGFSLVYTLTAGSATGGTATVTATTTTATLTGITQNLATPVTVAAVNTPCTAPTAAKADLCAGAYTASGTLNTVGAFASGTPCGFAVCAGGSGTGTGSGQYGAGIHIYYRSDVSGTTQSFLARLVAAGGSAGGAPSTLQFTGCGGDNQFDGCGGSYASAVSTGEAGNPLVINGVKGDANGLGYASDGLVQQSTSGVVPVNFQGYGQTVVTNLQGESTALSNIAKGIADVRNGGATYATDGAYIGWRPFMNAETSPPTGEVLRYLEFVMDPANNQNIAAATAEISVYASGLAGVVPITPITGYQETL